MSVSSWIRHRIARLGKRRALKGIEAASEETKREAPLREFVYLDAVSLHSLLVSQSATIPTEVSQAISRAEEAELSGSFGAKVGAELIGASIQADSAARYQTNNSNSMQSSRKAVIQTLFKELRELPLDFKLAERNEAPTKLRDVAEIARTNDARAVMSAAGLSRGSLVEVEVILAVDPVFKLGTMMNELTAITDELPEGLGDLGDLEFLRDAGPIMKVLERFLAGLIPIMATATNHVVVEVEGKDYVVHKSALDGLEVTASPLHIVGVTEHIGYWRDIRRVLFSDARFTMLCRIARDGIQEKWTPVKLADLFSDVAPDFVDQVNALRSPSATSGSSAPKPRQEEILGDALEAYREAIVPQGTAWSDGAEEAFQSLKARLSHGQTDASAQRRAFDLVRDLVVRELQIGPMDPDSDLKARQEARAAAGLELWPTLGANPLSTTTKPLASRGPAAERLIDVEVIAIYW